MPVAKATTAAAHASLFCRSVTQPALFALLSVRAAARWARARDDVATRRSYVMTTS
jgi:hypothetical protein